MVKNDIYLSSINFPSLPFGEYYSMPLPSMSPWAVGKIGLGQRL
jgi:hypothetical protein